MVLLPEKGDMVPERVTAHVLMTLSTTPFPIPGRICLSPCSALPAVTHLHSNTALFTSQPSLPNWEFPVIPTGTVALKHRDCFK